MTKRSIFKLSYTVLYTITLIFALQAFQAPAPDLPQELAALPLQVNNMPGAPQLQGTPTVTTTFTGTQVVTATIFPTATLTATGTIAAGIPVTAVVGITETMTPEAAQVVTVTPTLTETVIAPTVVPTPRPPIVQFKPRQAAGSLLTSLLLSGLILLLAWPAAALLRNGTSAVLNRVHPDVRVFVAQLVFYAVWVVAVIAVLRAFHIGNATLTALVGSIGLAFSLSSQDLFKNFIAGIYLLLEHPFEVGDEITFGNYSGTVLFIDLRTTMIHTDEGEEVIIPNTLLMSQVVVKNLKSTQEIPDQMVEDAVKDEDHPLSGE